MTAGQNSLRNFYVSVKFANPTLAALISDDVITIALYALADDKSPGQKAADRLRRMEFAEPLERVLNSALTELGYS